MKNGLMLYSSLLFFAVACTDIEDSSSRRLQKQFRLVADSEKYSSLPETRTQVGGVGSDGMLAVEWSPNDRIGVFGESSVNMLFTGTNTVPAGQTSFEGTMVQGDLPVYAYYPYSEGVADLHSIPVEIPDLQVYSGVESIAEYDIKAASEISPEADGSYRIRFRQMASLVRFVIDLTEVSYLEAGERLQDVTIHQTGTSVPMTGAFSYDLSALDGGLQVGDYSRDGITIYLESMPPVDRMVEAYAVVAPGQHKGNEWCCVFTTDRHVVTFYTTALCDFEAGKYYTVPINVSVLENNEAQVEEVPAEETEETANCYIVTETGEHDFLATVIGNGQEGILDGAGFHTSSAVIAPQSAGLLWSDVRDFISDVTLSEDGRVHYTVNSLSGNAVIAVYSGPGMTGDILWSWHIWGTGGEMPSDEVYTNKIGAKFTVMDRNLGAHSKIDINAMLYQWGRKDPFPNSLVYYDADGVEHAVETSFPVRVSQTGTIAESVMYPDQMQKYIDNTYQDWLAVSNNYLWGDTNDARPSYPDYLEGEMCGDGWTDSKTIYDPCPAGYRVANKYTWTFFVKRSDGNTSGISGVTNRLDNINYVKYDNGYYFMKDETDVEGTYYPPIGKRYGSSGTMIAAGQGGDLMLGESGYYWSSSPHDAGSSVLYSSYFHFGKYTEEPGVTGWSSGNGVNVCDFTSSRRDANGVRCVLEN